MSKELTIQEIESTTKPRSFRRKLERRLAEQLLAAMFREAAQKWQPIETVPDDVDAILAYSPCDNIEGGAIVTQAEYAYKAEPPGWFGVSDGNRLWGVTHWKPLPPPPVNHGQSND